ncbi:lipid asymmetry maintenance protein MlaB [Streptomyces sp. NPDC059371]|uniref:STAS domain-containing protein n=1 Tax=Streptomyces sp. NPDC059371 TaxID=3346812 RepID=UPI0036CE938C
MRVTTTSDGVTAVITPYGEIDFHVLPRLLTASQDLPPSVTQVTWDLRGARFMDVAGLHLLIHQRMTCADTGRTLNVTGLRQQPLRLLQLAAELFPAGEWGGFLPDHLPTAIP